MNLEPAEFTVDTGLFRQLGELLVGRDATALVELIKNAYDADATTVVVSGENLNNPRAATLQLVDNGVGMTALQFRRGFLRLAARGKTAGDRRSPIYQRRFTGEKGVGRLAAHKLAARIDIDSVAATEGELAAAQLFREQHQDSSSAAITSRLAQSPLTLVQAAIDWDLIEQADTLSDISDGLTLATGNIQRHGGTGTTLRLTHLRHAWDTQDLHDLGRQLGNFEPPKALVAKLPRSILHSPLLFAEPGVRDADRHDPGMRLDLQGDFASPEEYWGQVERSADWILEIRATRGQKVEYALTPTQAGLNENPYGNPLRASIPHPSPTTGPFFDARILLRSGSVPTLERKWSTLNSGIRIYLEGFRVLPYGEVGNDWLSLDFDYTRRAGRFQIDPLLGGPEDDLAALRSLSSRDVSLRLQPNRNYFGAVFLTESGSGGLRTLVNREGFVPDESYDRMVRIVRVGVDILQRAWALASFTQKSENSAAAQRARTNVDTSSLIVNHAPKDPPADPDAARSEGDKTDILDGEESTDAEMPDMPSSATSQGSGARLRQAIVKLQQTMGTVQDNSATTSGPLFNQSSDTDERAREALTEVERSAEALIEDASLLRVLASVGAQLSAFTHEIAQLVPAALAAEQSLEPQPGQRWPTEAVRARRAVTEVRRALERQSSYLVDVASNEGRRRRTRLSLRDRIDVAFQGFQGTAAARDIALINNVAEGLRTPPIFRSELQAILANLLSNAIKAAGDHGIISVDAAPASDGVRFAVQNTGVGVDLANAERWFLPYASTTTDLDPVLGFGMGLGLPITRDLVAEYGGTVRFTPPTSGFSTAVEVVLPA